jgi:hypothetical protein
MKTAAGKSDGKSGMMDDKAAIPPAEAPITTMSRFDT